MNYLLLLTSLTQFSDVGFRLSPQEVYHPLSQGTVAVWPDGSFVVLDLSNTRLLWYGADGTLVKTVGRAGQGPGEFGHPHGVYVVQDRLYVRDTGKALCFAKDGRFVGDTRTVAVGDTLRKLADGWLVHRLATPLRPKDQDFQYLIWMDDALKTEKVIARYPTNPSQKRENGKHVVYINPVREKLLLAYNADAGRVFFRLPGAAEIQIFDVAGGMVTGAAAVPFAPIPFDEAYGRERFARARRTNPLPGAVTLKEAFPETFPLVTDLEVGADGLLRAAMRLPLPDTPVQTAFFDRDGRPVPAPAYAAHAPQILARLGDDALVTTFDAETDILTLIRCTWADVPRILGSR